jgi:predicted RNA-binding protein Jag
MSEASVKSLIDPTSPKRLQVEQYLRGVFNRLSIDATFEFCDLANGGLGVSVDGANEVLKGPEGKRNHLLESLQYLVNKSVNKSGANRRWVTLSLNGLPVGATDKKLRAKREAPPAPPSRPAAPARGEGRRTERQNPKPRNQPQHSGPDESQAAVPPDDTWSVLGQQLAQKAAKYGRVYAVVGLNFDDRARMLLAGKQTPDQRTYVEGEGHFRRVVFQPKTLAPLPKRVPMPDYDEEE